MAFIGRLEDGRIIKLEDAKFSEFVNGDWAEPTSPFSADEYWNSSAVSESELKEASKAVGSN